MGFARRRPTRAERRLRRTIYAALNALGVRGKGSKKRAVVKQKVFRRLRGSKPFMVDFYLPEYKLVFEIDCKGIDPDIVTDEMIESVRKGDKRERALAKLGIKMVRITNAQTLDRENCFCYVLSVLRDRKKVITDRKKLCRDVKLGRLKITDADREAELEAIKRFLDGGGRITRYSLKGRLLGQGI